MRHSNRRSNTQSYSEQFKLARVFGAPTLDEIKNQFAIVEKNESYDSRGYPRLHSGPLALEPEPGVNSVYFIETADPAVRPIFRQVRVQGKEDYECGLLELQSDEAGLLIMMRKTVNDESRYTNLRFLPFVKLTDIILPSKTAVPLTVEIPDQGRIKLNVTIQLSSTGEPLFNTHSADISIENLPEDDRREMRSELELNAAKIIAHYATQELTFARTSSEQQMDIDFYFIRTIIIEIILNQFALSHALNYILIKLPLPIRIPLILLTKISFLEKHKDVFNPILSRAGTVVNDFFRD